jgi:hypothetical protein
VDDFNSPSLAIGKESLEVEEYNSSGKTREATTGLLAVNRSPSSST